MNPSYVNLVIGITVSEQLKKIKKGIIIVSNCFSIDNPYLLELVQTYLNSEKLHVGILVLTKKNNKCEVEEIIDDIYYAAWDEKSILREVGNEYQNIDIEKSLKTSSIYICCY